MRKNDILNNNFLDKPNIEPFRTYNLLFILPTLMIGLIVSLFFNIYTPIKLKKEKKHQKLQYEYMIGKLSDSLNYELNYANTLAEKCNLHTMIGAAAIEKNKNEVISKDSVWKYIKSLGVWYPEYIMAQAIVESNCGQTMPHKSNNMFGMTIPNHRETTALPKANKDEVYAKYKNWKLSVIDRILWELAVFGNIKPTEEEYLKRISCYAESPTYLDAIKSKAKEYAKKK